MKKILIAITASVITTLFAACSKESSPYDYTVASEEMAEARTEVSAGHSENEKTSYTDLENMAPEILGPRGTGAIQLIAASSANAPISWHSGNIAVGSVVFEGHQRFGHAFHLERNETKVGKAFDLFGTVDLASINLNTGLYYGMEFRVLLNPAGNSGAFSLSGNINNTKIAGSNIRVQVIMNESLALKAKWSGNIRVENGRDYTGKLFFDMAQLTNGITAEMLANAEKTNGVIVISMNSNRNLYQLIGANLHNNMHVQFG